MNRFNFNGFPSFIPIGFAFNPFTYLFTVLLPPFTDLHWFMFANMVSGGVFCSLFLRRLEISRLGSLVGGTCYITGSWWLVFTADYSPSIVVLPLAALVLLESQIRPVRATVFGSLLCGYAWLGVNTQVSLMIFTAFGAGALVLENAVIPERSLVLGVPGKVVRRLTAKEVAAHVPHARRYKELAAVYKKYLG